MACTKKQTQWRATEFCHSSSINIHTPLLKRFSILNQQSVETSHSKDSGDKLPDKELQKVSTVERKQKIFLKIKVFFCFEKL